VKPFSDPLFEPMIFRISQKPAKLTHGGGGLAPRTTVVIDMFTNDLF
jgi:hypothetical protein